MFVKSYEIGITSYAVSIDFLVKMPYTILKRDFYFCLKFLLKSRYNPYNDNLTLPIVSEIGGNNNDRIIQCNSRYDRY